MGKNADMLAQASKYLYPNYKPLPMVLERGQGAELWDVEGKRYLDLCAGVAVCSVGHAHPDHVRALAEQAGRLAHVSNYFYNDVNIRLAARLCERTGFARAFFCNSGTEANEALFKLARRHFWAKGEVERTQFIAFHNAVHGRTMGALQLTGTPKYREGFGDIGAVSHFKFGDLAAVKAALDHRVAAVVVEPVQGEGGVMPAPEGFLRGLREACDAAGALLFCDEVQTGIGRTGAFFGFESSGIRPDAVALAKGLGGGIPVGAFLCTEALAQALPPGTHGSTFGGNPLASASAMSVLDIIDREGLVAAAAEKGAYLGKLLGELAARLPKVCEGERGAGLLRGLVLREGMVARDILPKLAEQGVLVIAAGDRVLRFCPALVVTKAQLEEGVEKVGAVLSAMA
jgi:acetylornithine/N-succinyldiaminopimelate aminotransferase